MSRSNIGRELARLGEQIGKAFLTIRHVKRDLDARVDAIERRLAAPPAEEVQQ